MRMLAIGAIFQVLEMLPLFALYELSIGMLRISVRA